MKHNYPLSKEENSLVNIIDIKNQNVVTHLMMRIVSMFAYWIETDTNNHGTTFWPKMRTNCNALHQENTNREEERINTHQTIRFMHWQAGGNKKEKE